MGQIIFLGRTILSVIVNLASSQKVDKGESERDVRTRERKDKREEL